MEILRFPNVDISMLGKTIKRITSIETLDKERESLKFQDLRLEQGCHKIASFLADHHKR